jgi:hypothetical protein
MQDRLMDEIDDFAQDAYDEAKRRAALRKLNAQVAKEQEAAAAALPRADRRAAARATRRRGRGYTR